MRSRTLAALTDRLRRFSVLVEVGIGRNPAVAAALSADREVRATDVVERPAPPDVAFHVDDVTDPDPAVYAGADAIYALNLPPELHRPARATARARDASFVFTTLGTDAPAVPARPETLPGETLFWAMEAGHRPDTG